MNKSRLSAAPFALWMTLFTVVPLGVVIWFAFTNDAGEFTLENIWAIGDYIGVFANSIKLGAIATAICLLLAYPLAYSISRKNQRAQQTMVMMVMLPMWMNFLLRTYAWMSILENNGWINRLFRMIGVLGETESFPLINTEGAVVLGMVYNFLPFMVIPLYSVMVKIDGRVTEAAQDLGANGYHVFRRVILPLSTPGIVTGITMVFVPAVSTFVISKLLGGGKDLMIGDAIELKFIGQAQNYHVGASLSLILMILILICMVFTNKVDNTNEEGGGFVI